jgi:hypothetical protein
LTIHPPAVLVVGVDQLLRGDHRVQNPEDEEAWVLLVDLKLETRDVMEELKVKKYNFFR